MKSIDIEACKTNGSKTTDKGEIMGNVVNWTQPKKIIRVPLESIYEKIQAKMREDEFGNPYLEVGIGEVEIKDFYKVVEADTVGNPVFEYNGRTVVGNDE